jgi:hypothetical protein
MFIFVFLNLICLSIILAKFIWHSENSRQETARYVNKLFGVPKTELELIAEEQDGEELNHTCDQCNDGCDDDDKDEEDDLSTHDSMPPLVEAQTKEVDTEDEEELENKEEDEEELENKEEDKAEESDDVSIEHVNAEDLEVIKDTLEYIKKTKDMLIEIKSDLEKKID